MVSAETEQGHCHIHLANDPQWEPAALPPSRHLAMAVECALLNAPYDPEHQSTRLGFFDPSDLRPGLLLRLQRFDVFGQVGDSQLNRRIIGGGPAIK